MMELLCKVCDQSLIENESECTNYIATLRERNEKKFL